MIRALLLGEKVTREETGKKKGKADENSGHYVIASSRLPERRPLERRTLAPIHSNNNWSHDNDDDNKECFKMLMTSKTTVMKNNDYVEDVNQARILHKSANNRLQIASTYTSVRKSMVQ